MNNFSLPFRPPPYRCQSIKRTEVLYYVIPRANRLRNDSIELNKIYFLLVKFQYAVFFCYAYFFVYTLDRWQFNGCVRRETSHETCIIFLIKRNQWKWSPSKIAQRSQQQKENEYKKSSKKMSSKIYNLGMRERAQHKKRQQDYTRRSLTNSIWLRKRKPKIISDLARLFVYALPHTPYSHHRKVVVAWPIRVWALKKKRFTVADWHPFRAPKANYMLWIYATSWNQINYNLRRPVSFKLLFFGFFVIFFFFLVQQNMCDAELPSVTSSVARCKNMPRHHYHRKSTLRRKWCESIIYGISRHTLEFQSGIRIYPSVLRQKKQHAPFPRCFRFLSTNEIAYTTLFFTMKPMARTVYGATLSGRSHE